MKRYFILAALAATISLNGKAQYTWLKIKTGTEFTIALRSDSTLWSWGYNDNGQLGIGSTTAQTSPVQIGTDTDWKEIAAGTMHCAAIKSNGTLWTWGLNNNGQLGSGGYTQYNSPVQVGSDNNWAKVNASQFNTLAIRIDSSLWAWGANNAGQLGVGSQTNYNYPVQVGTINHWVGIACGGLHNHALAADGTLWGFGFNANGQIGDGTTNNTLVPVQVGAETNWIHIADGGEFSLGLKADGTIWSWGSSVNGQLGLGASASDQHSPTQIGQDSNWTYITAGGAFAFAINADSALFGWGWNGIGQLGIGSTSAGSPKPVQVGNDSSWITIAGATGFITGSAIYGAHSAGIKAPGYQFCATGLNYGGQLGDGTQTDSHVMICHGIMTNLPEYAEKEELLLYPNPSTGRVNVNLESLSGDTQGTVRSMDGRVVRSFTAKPGINELNLQDLPKGIYLVALQDEQQSWSEKIILTH